ncbi:hypothetical protein CF095_09495 [Clostridium botulinum]
MEIDSLGFHGLMEDINTVINELHCGEDELLEKSGEVLIEKCKDKTPYRPQDEKHIKDSYKLSPVKIEGDTKVVEMFNTESNFHLIERGHKRVTKSGKEIGFVPGVHMIERSVDELEGEFPKEVEKFIDEQLKKVNQ